MITKEADRIKIGKRLRELRESLGLSVYKVAKIGNIRICQVKAVEEGKTNYTIDIFIGYIRGCNLLMQLETKDKSDSKTHR